MSIYSCSRRRSFIEILAFEIFGIGIVITLLALVAMLVIFLPTDNAWCFRDSFTVPASFIGMAGLIWWGWYSSRIAKRIAARSIIRKRL